MEELVLSTSRANSEQAAVMREFLALFRTSDAPTMRMNGDQYIVDQQIQRRMHAAGFPTGGGERERLMWLYENADKVGIRDE